ncbi:MULTISPECIES: type III-A CRISPR-associated RAMP protein Csm3 [Thermodesulfovibrio]|jgi:CRISPR-associated protein Csm3|uniref:CRISPR system Cms endoribonuclease Csm3 n=1 Tax=Thermodesulfovibrio yellowstonii (strain ATCC 51303 / DSM 11347 / YP87) TaxID=289376 RepID=B5YJR3_THEYD|nr:MULTISPECIES: type III-A CRISPR-associated RAMP protein Csm3 [Thermodesulfovibrio]ACI20776.1 CRISPR-associated RAMP protein, Csm3 family [Thermodesulfovibrio yellowstonii DSM 11347]
MQLREIKTIKGTIRLKTGLHIGSGNTEMQIGGTDNPVIKHPYTNEPYIPGSSLKGKIRSLVELYYGVVAEATKHDDMIKAGGLASSKMLEQSNGGIKKHIENILKVFGSGAGDTDEKLAKQLGPTRVSFSDCFLTDQFIKEAEEKRWSYIEVKSENRINRITGTAEHPRFIERVPAGAEFKLEISFKILNNGEEELFKNYLLKGLKLLEYDSLGGSGSRGYGKVEFIFDDETLKREYDEIKLWG